MKDKVRILFTPFILTLSLLIIGYTLLHWLLFIELELLQPKRVISHYLIPVILTASVVLFIFRRRFNILKFETKTVRWRNSYSLNLWIILSIPLLISQWYIETATGELTELNSINEIDSYESTKYYSLKSYYIDKSAMTFHPETYESLRDDEKFKMYVYVASPIFEKASDTTNMQSFAWYGIKYYKSINRRLVQGKKDEKYQEFISTSLKDFENKDVSEFIYFERIGNSHDRESFIKAVNNIPGYSASETILLGVNEPFEARNGQKLGWVLGTSFLGSIIWLIMISIPKINEDIIEQNYNKKRSIRNEDFF